MQDIITKIMDEIRSNESDKAYRAMHQTLTRIGFAVDKDSARLGLKELDPEGVALISRQNYAEENIMQKGQMAFGT